MMLLTKEVREKLPKLYATEEVKLEDKVVEVKFFTPWTNWTWYAVEGEEQEDGDWIFFGLVDGQELEWGNFSLRELESLKGPFGLKVERDRGFRKKISEVTMLAGRV